MPDVNSPGTNDLVVAVYLDTNVLLDLLATVEDGFSLVERVTSGSTASRGSEQGLSGELGGLGVLNFFKLGLSGRLGRSTSRGSSETVESDRTHTYGSLLHRLRTYLSEERLLEPVDSNADRPIPVGSFVEFSGAIRANPFTASFRHLQRMLKLVEATTSQSSSASSGGRPNRAPQQSRQAAPRGPDRVLQEIGGFIDQLTTDVEREGTSTVLVENSGSGLQAVITLFDVYLRDRSMAELLNREFRVLGKVARHLPRGSSDSVDLVASSGISGFPPTVLTQLSEMIEQMSGAGVARIATPQATVAPPVLEIIPIAVYL